MLMYLEDQKWHQNNHFSLTKNTKGVEWIGGWLLIQMLKFWCSQIVIREMKSSTFHHLHLYILDIFIL